MRGSAFRSFMMSSGLMAPGWIIRIMDMYGCLQEAAISVLMAPAGTGSILTKAGPGYPVIAGVGRLFIMATGSTTITIDGCGCRDMNGPLPGSPGNSTEPITARPP